MSNLMYWGLVIPSMGNKHVTFEYFGMNTPGDFPEGIKPGDRYQIKITHTGVYMKDHHAMNAGVRVELPEELRQFYKNDAVPHITMYYNKELSVPKNTALCKWEPVHTLTPTYVEAFVYGFSLTALNEIYGRIDNLVSVDRDLPDLDEVEDYWEYLKATDSTLQELHSTYPVEFESRHIIKHLECRLDNRNHKLALYKIHIHVPYYGNKVPDYMAIGLLKRAIRDAKNRYPGTLPFPYRKMIDLTAVPEAKFMEPDNIGIQMELPVLLVNWMRANSCSPMFSIEFEEVKES